MHGNRTREKLLAGQPVHVLGGHNHSAATIDFIGPLGFDGFWIEGEHAAVTFDKIGDVSRACDLWGITSVMRVHDNNPGLIGRTLDCGVNGIVIPHVSTKEAAEQVVRATRFAPLGMRGMYSGRRGYGVENYIQKANDEVLVVVLIEEIEAVENLDEILTVDGIDVFFVAPGDLAQTMGYVGDWDRSEVQDGALKKIVAAGRHAGCLVNENNLQEQVDTGVLFFHMYYDAWIRQGAQAYLDNVGKLLK
jgi:4-hydroxy-2-oxoheptanedioate aldolase